MGNGTENRIDSELQTELSGVVEQFTEASQSLTGYNPGQARQNTSDFHIPLFTRLFGDKPAPDTHRVLCLDGGGIKGIIPAVFLMELEHRTSRRITELFDHVAGTSTGSILASCFATPDLEDRTRARWTALEVVEIYKRLGRQVFARHGLREHLHSASPFTPKYHNDALAQCLQEAIGLVNLSEAVIDLTIPAFAICLREAFVFSSVDAKASLSHDYPLWEVARASSAAPTYFEPYAMTDRAGGPQRVLVDGGLVANNPSMCAFADIERRGASRDLVMVSLGTGSMHKEFEWPAVKEWGVAQWARPMISLLMDGSSQSIDFQLRHVLGSNRYRRFQIPLAHECEHLDDASDANIERLIEHGQRLVRRCDREIDEMCEVLVR